MSIIEGEGRLNTFLPRDANFSYTSYTPTPVHTLCISFHNSSLCAPRIKHIVHNFQIIFV